MDTEGLCSMVRQKCDDAGCSDSGPGAIGPGALGGFGKGPTDCWQATLLMSLPNLRVAAPTPSSPLDRFEVVRWPFSARVFPEWEGRPVHSPHPDKFLALTAIICLRTGDGGSARCEAGRNAELTMQGTRHELLRSGTRLRPGTMTVRIYLEYLESINGN